MNESELTPNHCNGPSYLSISRERNDKILIPIIAPQVQYAQQIPQYVQSGTYQSQIYQFFENRMIKFDFQL